jgi:TolB-like protein/DNA-binding winged helix-turn-helix (wHTH) protein
MPIMADADRELRNVPVNLAGTGEFVLGQWRVIPARREIHVHGERRELEPQVMKVLVALAASRPEVVSRDRLVDLCWEGRVVGDDTLNRCIVALRHLVKDLPGAPFAIETVRGVGYAMVETRDTPRTKKRGLRLGMVGALAAISIAIAVALFAGWTQFRPSDTAPASIAVLPFRNLSPGDSFFAEGISEEILGQLGREPQFRVAGRMSSSQFGETPDVREIAARLNVDYVLEGSVRRQGDQVRVNAGLVRASDGTQLWTDTYNGNTTDVFAIQQQVGADIADALRRKLIRSPNKAPAAANPKAYDLYLVGRSLLRTRQRSVGRTASGVLRDSINIDASFAPAWAALAEATELEGADRGNDGLIAARASSRRFAQRALVLDPDLGLAHLELARTAPYGSAEFVSHIARATQLDPSDAEAQIWFGVASGAQGRFDEELAAYRRAFAIDPLWFRTTGQLAMALAERGRRKEATTVASRGLARDPINLNILLGRIAWIFGDHSEAVRNWTAVVHTNSPRWRGPAQRNLDDALFMVGLAKMPGDATPRAQDMRHRGHVWMTAAPTLAEWKSHNRDAYAAEVYQAENTVAAKLMVQASRSSELAAAYDSPLGLLGVRAGQPIRIDQLREAPVVALALRQAGRQADSERVLNQAEARVRNVRNPAGAPFWWEAEAAAVAAVRGDRAVALDRLENALRGGWTHEDATDLRDLADEPVFRSLHGDSRFEAIRLQLAARLIRERSEIAALRL